MLESTRPEFAGKVALVTGAGSGIGAACAIRLAEAGARLIVIDVDEASAKTTAAGIEDRGGEALAMACDVADPAAVTAAVAAALDAFGRLDLAVNNAGVAPPRSRVDTMPLEDWRRVIDINLSGVFYCLRAEIPAMAAGGGGSIVNMASVLGVVGLADTAGYVAAKHGVIGLTKTAALDCVSRGIRVNALAPGFVDTPLLDRALEGGSKRRRSSGAALLTPMGRLATVDEVTEVALFLLSDRSSVVTGSVYLADGGYSAR